MSPDNEDKLIVYGQVSLKDGTTAPVYYVHEIEDDKAQVIVKRDDKELWITLTEPYSQLRKWRNARDLFLVEA